MTAENAAFVRTEMVPPAPPPATETGPVKWLRENLFSSWVNAVLTVLFLYAVWWVLSHVLPWAVYGIWQGSSLTECRAIRDALYGPDASVACWAVISERWKQLLFGFYPQSLYWRSILSLGIFIVAVAPVLASGLPRKMLWFSLCAPFIIYWLLWGGSIWPPVVVALALAAVGVILARVASRQGQLTGVLVAIIAFALLFLPVLSWVLDLAKWIAALFNAETPAAIDLWAEEWGLRSIFPLVGTISDFLQSHLPFRIRSVTTRDFGGFQLSFIIGVSGITLSLPLGILLALGRQSDLLIVRAIAVGFIEIIRGVPLIVWLFTASLLLNYFLPPGTNFDLMLRVIIMVTLFAAAYIAEVIRGGLAALPKGQYEAADALGLDYWKSMRLIILPQALKISIPGIVNTFIGMFKDTTLVVFIGLLDPVGLTNSIRANQAWNGIYWELFIFIGALFFVVCFGMSRYSMYLERKLARDRR